MGSLYYGNTDQPLVVPDRLLAHVRVVTTTKLRRNESFTLTWLNPAEVGGGRSTIWLHASIPLKFVFDAVEPESLDPALLNELANAANSTSGLTVDLRAEPDTAPVGRAAIGRAA